MMAAGAYGPRPAGGLGLGAFAKDVHFAVLRRPADAG